MKTLDDFVRQLAQQLLALHDEESGKDVALTPFELEEVGQKLAAYAKGLIDTDLGRMQGP